MNKAQLKTTSLIFLFLIVLSLLIYAVSTSLLSPVTGFIDDDSFLDLRGSCTPTAFDGTTNWNITNATLYITSYNGTGTGWLRNATIQVPTSLANVTYLFNFTNFVNFTAEGTYKWNIECHETNMSTGVEINKAFEENNTLIVTYASPTVTIEPANNFIDLDSDGVNFTAIVTPPVRWNISRVEFWTNITGGTWALNQSYGLDQNGNMGALDQTIFANFSIDNISNSLADGTVFVWSIYVRQRLNVSGSEVAAVNGITSLNKSVYSANRTFHIERPPIISLVAPTTSSWQREASSVINFTANSSFISTSTTGFTCQFFTNETGVWNAKLTGIPTTNGTYKSFNYQFANELSDIRWGVFCHENADSRVGNFSVNSTVLTDRTLPIPAISLINLSPPINNTFFSTGSLIINYSVTDSYQSACRLYVNNTLNNTDVSAVKAGNFTMTASDGLFVLSIGCNDTAGNFVNESRNYWITIDTVYPTYSAIGNVSVSGSAHQRMFNITLSELTNITIYYGTTTDATSKAVNNTFQLRHNVTISNFSQNTVYLFNITVCDRAGLCNNSVPSLGQGNFTFPYKLLTGWSYYGVYDARINFSTILNQSEAEFAYYWNHTGQKWVSAQAGTTANMGFEVGTRAGERSAGGRHVIALYEGLNSTWVRNISSPTRYAWNITTGDNFIKLIDRYTFGNFSRTFLNTSYSDGTSITGYEFGIDTSRTPGNLTYGDTANVTGGLFYNMTDFFFSAYNNTAGTWEPYYVYNSTLENGTLITSRIAGDYTDIDVMWLFSRHNLTKNSTNVIGNWTY